ncbi:MaoC family dehydratase [Pseudochelatococcus sp. B33]
MVKKDMLYEDIELGSVFYSESRTVTKQDILDFARVTGDDHPLHVDEEFCQKAGYNSLIAHGLFSVALMEGLKNKLKIYEHTSIGSLGWNNIRFIKPLFPGDTVHLQITFSKKRKSKKPGRGVVSEEIRVINQNNEIICEGEHTTLLMSEL